MINYTAEQIEQAVSALPSEMQGMLFAQSTEYQIQVISAMAGLSVEQSNTLNFLANFILMGFIPYNNLAQEIKNELGVEEVRAAELAQKVFKEVLTPILEFKERVILEQKQREEQEKQDEEEYNELVADLEVDRILAKATGESEGKKEEVVETQPEVASPGVPSRPLERMPDVAPDNLPTGEGTVSGQESMVNGGEAAPLMPPLKLKMRPADDAEEVESGEVHPFEEKMKKVFTGGTADMGDLALSPTTPSQAATSRVVNDPYREPLE